MTAKQLINTALKAMNLRLGRYKNITKALEESKRCNELNAYLTLIPHLPEEQLGRLVNAIPHAKSQFGQDLFVLAQHDFKQGGFFVEFGATNGINLSNTHILESIFRWNGIVAEPSRQWHRELKKNRKCEIDFNCVYSTSGATVHFEEVAEAAGLSTIAGYGEKDQYHRKQKGIKRYTVTTISLNDLLKIHNAPNVIDYLSIDTEGSEYEILSHFDFSCYDIRIISCEHNYTENRDKIYDLLTKHGYTRVLVDSSGADDWYVKD